MTEYLFHGDPCSRCPIARPGHPVRAAVTLGMCPLCFLGASEPQRRAAADDALADHPADRLKLADDLRRLDERITLGLLDGLYARPAYGEQR